MAERTGRPKKTSAVNKGAGGQEYPPETLELALKILQTIRETEPQTISDLPVKVYEEGYIESLLDRHCSSLSEHVDTIQIFVTRHAGGKTIAYTSGLGNEFARVAQVQSWLELTLGGRESDPEGS